MDKSELIHNKDHVLTSNALDKELVWHFVKARGVIHLVMSSISPDFNVLFSRFSNSVP